MILVRPDEAGGFADGPGRADAPAASPAFPRAEEPPETPRKPAHPPPAGSIELSADQPPGTSTRTVSTAPPFKPSPRSVAASPSNGEDPAAGGREPAGSADPSASSGERSAAMREGSAALGKSRLGPASGYSPARPKGPAPAKGIAASGENPPASDGAPPPELDVEGPASAPELGQLGADFTGYSLEMSMLTGGVRVQISAKRDFSEVLLDKTFDFADDFKPQAEFREAGLSDGVYWARMAVRDLLGYQYPYTEVKPYRYKE